MITKNSQNEPCKNTPPQEDRNPNCLAALEENYQNIKARMRQEYRERQPGLIGRIGMLLLGRD